MDSLVAGSLQFEEEVLDEDTQIRPLSALDQGLYVQEEESSVRNLAERQNTQRISEQAVPAQLTPMKEQHEPSDEEMPPLQFTAIEENHESSTASPEKFDHEDVSAKCLFADVQVEPSDEEMSPLRFSAEEENDESFTASPRQSYPADSVDDLENFSGPHSLPSVNYSSSGELDQAPSPVPVVTDFIAGTSRRFPDGERRSGSPQIYWSDLLIPQPPEQVFTEHLNESDVIIIADGRNKHFNMIHDVMYYSHRYVVPIVLDLTELRQVWREYFAKIAPNIAFPQLWLIGKCRGTFSDVVAMYRSKELHELLRKVVIRYDERQKERLRIRAALAKQNSAANPEKKLIGEDGVEQSESSAAFHTSAATPFPVVEGVDPVAESLKFIDADHSSAWEPVTVKNVVRNPHTAMEQSDGNEDLVSSTPIELSAEEKLKSSLENSDVVVLTKGRGKSFLLMVDAIKCAHDGSPVIIDVRAKGVECRAAALRLSAGVAFPQLWVNGECKGTLDDVIAFNDSGRLKGILRGVHRNSDR